MGEMDVIGWLVFYSFLFFFDYIFFTRKYIHTPAHDRINEKNLA